MVSRNQSFLPYSEVACARSLSFFIEAALPGVAGLGLIVRKLTKNLLAKVWHENKLGKIRFQRNVCYHENCQS